MVVVVLVVDFVVVVVVVAVVAVVVVDAVAVVLLAVVVVVVATHSSTAGDWGPLEIYSEYILLKKNILNNLPQASTVSGIIIKKRAFLLRNLKTSIKMMILSVSTSYVQ